MKIKSLLLIIIFLSFIVYVNKHQESSYSKEGNLVDEILYNTEAVIGKKFNLKVVGTGAAMPEGIIKKLSLSFCSNKVLTKNELRILLHEVGNELLTQVNINKKIQKFLVRSPFSIENVQIIIFNYENNGSETYDPQISVADLSKGVFTYQTKDSNGTYGYKNTYTETYEEALKAIQNNDLFGSTKNM